MRLKELCEVINGNCLYSLSESEEPLSKREFEEKYNQLSCWTNEVHHMTIIAHDDMAICLITIEK